MMPGLVTRELDPHTENGQIWRVLEVTLPDSVPYPLQGAEILLR